MELNVTYHWIDLYYLYPNRQKIADNTWGPTARAIIDVKAELPTINGSKEMYGTYATINIPITGTMEPTKEIIQSIQNFADENHIEIQFDFLNSEKNKHIGDNELF